MNSFKISVLGIKIVHQIKYLGILIDDKRNCFESQKKRTLKSAERFSNQIIATRKKLQQNVDGQDFLEKLNLDQDTLWN